MVRSHPITGNGIPYRGSAMAELDDLRATVDALAARVRQLEDHLEITQLVAQYGPAVDSGSADAAAALWTEDGGFDAVPYLQMRGHDDIAGMVRGDGHQSLILQRVRARADGAARRRATATRPRVAATRSTSGGTPRPTGSGSRGCRRTRGAGCAPRRVGASPTASTPTSTAPLPTGRCSRRRRRRDRARPGVLGPNVHARNVPRGCGRDRDRGRPGDGPRDRGRVRGPRRRRGDRGPATGAARRGGGGDPGARSRAARRPHRPRATPTTATRSSSRRSIGSAASTTWCRTGTTRATGNGSPTPIRSVAPDLRRELLRRHAPAPGGGPGDDATARRSCSSTPVPRCATRPRWAPTRRRRPRSRASCAPPRSSSGPRTRVNGVFLGPVTGESLDVGRRGDRTRTGHHGRGVLPRSAPRSSRSARSPRPSSAPGSVLFFASDLAAPVTGQHLSVNGGQWVT